MMENVDAGHESNQHLAFRVDASDRAHVYQQKQGYQFNVDQAYFSAAFEVPQSDLATRIEDWPKASELDPLELGVHRAAIDAGNAVPSYVARDFDKELRSQYQDAARNGGFMILVGDSTAGKSRSAYEALRDITPDCHVFTPDGVDDFEAALAALISAGGRCVVWLDDFERFIGTDGLRPTVITHLRGAGVLVIATMRSEHYRRFNRSDRGADHEEHGVVTAFQRIVNQGRLVFIHRQWTPTELRRAEQTSDRRIHGALAHAATFGVAEYLAAGPLLRDEWNMAWGPETSPRGAALVAAAVDCARAGLDSPLPVALIVRLHEFYLSRAGGELLQPESLEAALAWASRRRYGVTSLLIPIQNGSHYRAFEYLTDVLSREAGSAPIPRETWRTVLEFASSEPPLLFGVAHAARENGEFEIEKEGWRLLALSGNGPASMKLGLIFKLAGRVEEAEEWFQKSLELGESEGATQLGLMYEEKRQATEAEQHFRAAAAAGNSHGMFHLAALFDRQGDMNESGEMVQSCQVGRKGGVEGWGIARACLCLGGAR